MTRIITTLVTFALSTPLAAHEGLALDGALHQLLHRVGSDNVLGGGAIVLAGVAALVLRRVLRARAGARADAAR